LLVPSELPRDAIVLAAHSVPGRCAAEAASPARRKTCPQTRRAGANGGAVTHQARLTQEAQQELAGLPTRIKQLGAAIAGLHAAMIEPDFVKQLGARIASEQSRLQDLETQLTAAYSRWEVLEG
jgi:ATP-binding cassette subfamily F protein uup